MSANLHIDFNSSGLEFKGIGAVTSNGMSRLLYDYPDNIRKDILDLLFLPFFGASFHTLKVEIGSDANGTGGTEPSHMRSRSDFDISRGVGLRIAQEAKKRNPDIILDAIRWGTPAWTTRSYDDKYLYYLNFLKGAKAEYNLDFDYLAPDENEGDYDVFWVVDVLRPGLDRDGFRNVGLTGADSTEEWNIAAMVQGNPDLRNTLAAITRHYKQDSPQEAKDCGLPIFNTEDLAPFRNKFEYALMMAYKIIRSYVSGRMVQYVMHPVIEAMYDSVPYSYKAILAADTPWSGHYTIEPGLWVTAHFTQFTQPGWIFIDCACTSSYGISSLCLKDPENSGLSIIILNMGEMEEDICIDISGFDISSLKCWITNEEKQFNRIADLIGKDGNFRLAMPGKSIVTLTTTGGQKKGSDCLTVPMQADFILPYTDDFSAYETGAQPRYAVDQGGAFEIGESDGRKCLQQVITRDLKPVDWERRPTPPPFTLLGSEMLTNCITTIRFKFEELSQSACKNYVMLGLRANWAPARWDFPQSYNLRLYEDGRWLLLNGFTVLRAGCIDNFNPLSWHMVSVKSVYEKVCASVDGICIAEATDYALSSGNIVIGSSYSCVSFSDFSIEPVGSLPAICRRFNIIDKRIKRSSGWSEAGSNPDNYFRTLLGAGGKGENITFSFYGTSLSIIGIQGEGLGKSAVFIDGKEFGSADQFSMSPRSRISVFSVNNLSLVKHDVRIDVLGEKNADSQGTAVCINAIETDGELC